MERVEPSSIAAVPFSPIGTDSHKIPMARDTSERQSLRRLSASKPHRSEPKPSTPSITRDKPKPQPQAQWTPHVRQRPTSYDSSDDEILMPMKLSALTKALLNDEPYESGIGSDVPGQRPAFPSLQSPSGTCATRSALTRSTPSTSKGCGRQRVSTARRERTRDARADNFDSPPANSTPLAETHRRGGSPVRVKRVVRLSRTPRCGDTPNELRRSMSASTQRARIESRDGFIAGQSHTQTRPKPDEQHPKLEDTQRSRTPPVSSVRTVRVPVASTGKRIRPASSGGGLLSGPARRGRPTQVEGTAEACGSPVRRDHQIVEATSKAPSPSRLPDMLVQESGNYKKASLNQFSLTDIPPNHANENQYPPALPEKELSNLKPSRRISLGTGRVVPQRASVSPERRALAVRSQNSPNRPTPSLPKPELSATEVATTTQEAKKRQVVIRVNGRAYTRMDCLGRGGSGKVYRVATKNGTILALKRVSLANVDEPTEKGLRREIELLQRLRGVERVVQLLDYEMNREKQSLHILMQVGELDFNTLLINRSSGGQAPSYDVHFVRHYWKEMLECVRAIHALSVVHSDLKPANFVLANGRLKLIDFGIANAIQTDVTINVHRETMAGTVNYMSPESLMDSHQYALTAMHGGHVHMPAGSGPKVVKVGKPSDVWSLGCILYQMVYGTPPFGKMAGAQSRIRAIVDWSHRIDFPAVTEDGSCVPASAIQTMRRCLSRDQNYRPSCGTMLTESNDFFYPREYNPEASAAGDGVVLPMTEELLGRIIQDVVTRCKGGIPADDEIAIWPSAYWLGMTQVT